MIWRQNTREELRRGEMNDSLMTKNNGEDEIFGERLREDLRAFEG
jgi:hypothetical protein